MTQEQQGQLEKDAVYAAHVAEKEANAHRLRLAMMGEELVRVGEALQSHPEQVKVLPDPQSPYDYSEGARLLRTGERILEMCKEVAVFDQRVRTAEQRKGLFSLRPSGVQNSD